MREKLKQNLEGDGFLEKVSPWLTLMPEELFPVYVVGGTIRDYLLGFEIQDIDIAHQLAGEIHHQLKSRKDITVFPLGENKSKRCFRVVSKQNKGIYIDLCELEGDSIAEDLSKRDFTVNAVAVEFMGNGKAGKVIDPLEGLKDIEEKVLKVVGDKAFINDPLRLMRAFRFHGLINFAISQETLKLIKKNKRLINNVSQERVSEELIRIFSLKNSYPVIQELEASGLLVELFPEINEMKGCEQGGYHHLDVWEHSTLALRNCEKILNSLSEFFPTSHDSIERLFSQGDNKALLKFAVLLHDIAKPKAKRVCPNDKKTSFRRHDLFGSEMIEEHGKRLKLSNKAVELLRVVVREHRHIHDLLEKKTKQRTVINWLNKQKDKAVFIIVLGLADRMSALGKRTTEESRKEYYRKSVELIDNYFSVYRDRFNEKPLLTGNDLIAMGYKPGKTFKEVLSKIKEEQHNKSISTKEEAILFVQEYLKLTKAES